MMETGMDHLEQLENLSIHILREAYTNVCQGGGVPISSIIYLHILSSS